MISTAVQIVPVGSYFVKKRLCSILRDYNPNIKQLQDDEVEGILFRN